MSDRFDRGITVREMTPMDQAIDVSSETTTAFVGRALRGPVNQPVLVHSFGEFRRRFGDVWTRSSLGPAVQTFFEHGGRNLIIVRIANNARGAMICLPADGSALVLRAMEPGVTECIRVAVDHDGVAADEDLFNLTVQRIDPDSGLIIDQEMFRGVSIREDSDDFIGDAMQSSSLARVEKPHPTHRPEVTLGSGSQFESSYVGHAQPGNDGGELSDYDFIGSLRRETGLFALQQVEHFDLLYVPPLGQNGGPGATAVLAAERYCRERGAMLISDPPTDWLTAEDAIKGVRDLGYGSSNMVGYFPRVYQRDDQDGVARVAGAALAGLLCKLDRKHGPWLGLDQHGLDLNRRFRATVDVTESDAHLLARAGLNVIAKDKAGRLLVSGSATMARCGEVQHRYSSLTVRRTCLRIISAIDRGTRWAVFETGDMRLADRVQSQVLAYLSSLAGIGAFENDIIAVHCDAGISERPGGVEHDVTILLTFQPAGSAVPISLTLHQTVTGCRVTSTAFPPVAEICA